MPITDTELAALVEGVTGAVKEFVTREKAALEHRLALLETQLAIAPRIDALERGHVHQPAADASLVKRVEALERRPLPRWAGTWQPRGYNEGEMTTRSGSLWYATQDTSDMPGAGGTPWRLIVKSGAVPRDKGDDD